MKTYLNLLLLNVQETKYSKWYTSIINKAYNRQIIPNTYYEKHHILPKCFNLGGEKDKNNIIYLYPKEHLLCHKLLVKILFSKEIKAKLTYALWQMSTLNSENRQIKISSTYYQYLKNLLSENTKHIPKSEEHKQNMKKPKSIRHIKTDEHKEKIRLGRIGKKRTIESKEKQSQTMKGRYIKEDNPFFGRTHTEESIEKMKNTMDQKYGDNKPWLTPEVIKKRSEKRKSKPTWNKGISMAEEAKSKVSESLKGRIGITNGLINKRVFPINFENNYDKNIWYIGFTKKS